MGTLVPNTVIAPYDSIAGRRESWDPIGAYISNIFGAIIENNTITINGVSFGNNGPNIHLFEDFSGGVNGVAITTANSNFDVVADETTNKAIPYFTNDARSGSLAADIFRVNPGNTLLDATPMQCNFSPTNEILVSYALKCPDGSKWPGDGVGEEDFGSDSNYKFFWLIDSINGPSGTFNDLVLWSSVATSFYTQGNDLELGTIPSGASHWQWDVWNRFLFWVKANVADPAGTSGNLFWQIINTNGYHAAGTTPIIFATGSGAPNTWDRGTFGANARTAATNSGRKVLMDDCYLAVGANAAARVELGNNAVYSSCTKLALCEIISWSNTSLQVTIHAGDLNLSAATWMFITLPDNVSQISKQVVTP